MSGLLGPGFEGGLFKKLFKGYIFCFLGHLVGGQLFELFARETNLKKKSSVCMYVTVKSCRVLLSTGHLFLLCQK